MKQPHSTQNFADAVISSVVHPDHRMVKINQRHDGRLMSVNKFLLDKYPVLNCWHNCEHKVAKDGGKVIFGWAIFWAAGMYQAQHHAVWESPKGDFLDVTPDIDPNVLLIDFLPDGRVPYNNIRNSHPVSCYYTPCDKSVQWGLRGVPNPPRMTSFIWYVQRGR